MKYKFTYGDRFLIYSASLIFAALLIYDFGVFWQGCHDPNSYTQYYSNSNYNNCAADGIVSLVWNVGALIHDRRDDLNAFSTLTIAAFTVVLALVTARQARLTRLLAATSQEHAGHADRAIKVSQDSAVRQLRAYVSISGFDANIGRHEGRAWNGVSLPFGPTLEQHRQRTQETV